MSRTQQLEVDAASVLAPLRAGAIPDALRAAIRTCLDELQKQSNDIEVALNERAALLRYRDHLQMAIRALEMVRELQIQIELAPARNGVRTDAAANKKEGSE